MKWNVAGIKYLNKIKLSLHVRVLYLRY